MTIDERQTMHDGNESKVSDLKSLLVSAMSDERVVAAAEAILKGSGAGSLVEVLEFARALAASCGAEDAEQRLRAELRGFSNTSLAIPVERKALGFASPFPVRALDLGLLDPEEIFLANREKFSQVT